MATTTRTLLDMAAIEPGDRVLAVGVGTGGEAFAAAARVGSSGRIVATDLSPAMIDQARDHARELGLENVEFGVTDAQHLDFPEAAFDAVISRNVLMFVPDLAHALRSMRRLLKPSGRIGATVWSTGNRNPRISGPLAAAKALGATPPGSSTYRIGLRLGSTAVLRAAFADAGFSDLDVRRVQLTADYPTLTDAVAAAMEQAGTRELVGLLGERAETRMRRSLERRWARYADAAGAHLPGEQLVVAANP